MIGILLVIIQTVSISPAISAEHALIEEKYQGLWLKVDTSQFKTYTDEVNIRGFIFQENWPESPIGNNKEAGILLPADLKVNHQGIEWPNVETLLALPEDRYLEKYIQFVKAQTGKCQIHFVVLSRVFYTRYPALAKKLATLSDGYFVTEDVFKSEDDPSRKSIAKKVGQGVPILFTPTQFEQTKKWIKKTQFGDSHLKLPDESPSDPSDGSLWHEVMQAGITLYSKNEAYIPVYENRVAFWSSDSMEEILWEQLLRKDFLSVSNVKTESVSSGVWVIIDARDNYQEALAIHKQIQGYHPVIWVGATNQWPDNLAEVLLILPQDYEGATFDLSLILAQKGRAIGQYHERRPTHLQDYTIVYQPIGQSLYFDRSIQSQMNSEPLDSLDLLAQELVTGHGAPGGQLLVAKDGKIIKHSSFGYLTYDSLIRVEHHTLYDLASVTKVMATSLAAMHLYEQGRLPLDSPLAFFLPHLSGTSKEKITIKQLLTHNGGLRAYVPFWKKWINLETSYDLSFPPSASNLEDTDTTSTSARDSLYQWLFSSDVDPVSTLHFRYSDLGFILLQLVIEQVSATPLDQYVNQFFYQPLGLRRTIFNPIIHKFPLYQIAPTEYDYYFRKELVWGQVHDNNAAILGGVSGHAGLFSTAYDLAVLLQMLLQEGNYMGRQYLSASTIELFNQSHFQDNHRGLGWDKPFEKSNYLSEWASEKSFGHTGYTGTMVWADPEHKLIFVLLTNRVYPNAENRNFHRLETRRKMHDLVYKSFITER